MLFRSSVGWRLTVKGNLYVDGDLNSSSTHVGKSTLVRGNINLPSNDHKFLGAVRATGTFFTSNSIASSFNDILHVGGKVDLPEYQNITATVAGLGSRFQQKQVTTGPEWILPSILNTPESPRTEAEEAKLRFPMITMKDPVWDNFVTGDWDAMTKDIRKTSGKCDISDFTAPIVISTPTKVDLTACPSVTWGRGLEFVLKSDLVVFVKGLTQNGSNTMKVRTANASGDETRHTLYIVALPESGQTECVAGKGGNIKIGRASCRERVF